MSFLRQRTLPQSNLDKMLTSFLQYMPLLEELNYMPTEKYAHSKELLTHSEMIGKHYGLYEKALFQTEVNSIKWDESAKVWVTKTNRGDTIKSQFIVPAAGPLHRPKMPGLPIEKFTGHSFHSARWDYAYTKGVCFYHYSYYDIFWLTRLSRNDPLVAPSS